MAKLDYDRIALLLHVVHDVAKAGNTNLSPIGAEAMKELVAIAKEINPPPPVNDKPIVEQPAEQPASLFGNNVERRV